MFECKTCHHNPIVLMTQEGKWFATCSNYRCFSHENENIMQFDRKQDAINEWNKENPYSILYHDVKRKKPLYFHHAGKTYISRYSNREKRVFNEYDAEYIEKLERGK